MGKAAVYNNEPLAGYLEKRAPDDYRFVYDDSYRIYPAFSSISLTLSKTRPSYQSATLFPFFAGLLAEGVNKDIQCRLLRIDEEDDFTRLLKTAGKDNIGAITVKEIMAAT